MLHLVRNELGPPPTDASSTLQGLAIESEKDAENAVLEVPLKEQLHDVHLRPR